MTESELEQLEQIESQEQKAFPKRVLALVSVGVVVCAAGYWALTSTPPAAPRISEDALAVMDAKLQNLDKTVALYGERITKLETIAEAQSHKATQPAEAQPVSGVSAPPMSGEDAKRIDALEKEIAALKSTTPLKDAEHVAHSIKLLSAFHRLSDKVLSGKPFADVLTAFENETGDTTSKNKPLSQISAYADNGIPTLAELLTSFDNAAEQLNATQSVPPADAGVWDRLTYNLTHLVRVQRIDAAQTGKDVDAIVGRAAAHLDKDEVEAAYAEINTLPENAKASFANWLEEAQIAIDVPGIMDQLEEQVMQEVFHTEVAPEVTAAPEKGTVTP